MPDRSNDDTLISQDDIDKLLSADSIDEAEESFLSDDEEIGELSQDDIDNLLNASALSSDDDDDPPSLTSDEEESLSGNALQEDDDDDFGELSQDDIDALLGGAPSEEDDGTDGAIDGDDENGVDEEDDGASIEEDDDIGELSQDDIDALLGSASLDEDDGGGNGGDEEDDGASIEDDGILIEDDDEIGELSQDDIDSLLNVTELDTDEDTNDDVDASDDELDELDELDEPVSDADDDLGLISQEDIDALMTTDDLEEDIDTEAIGQGDDIDAPTEENLAPHPADSLIDASEALDIEQSLITQETLDNLLAKADEDESEGDEAADGIQDDDASFQVNLADPDDAPDDLDGVDGGGDDLSSEDVDALLADAGDDDEEDLGTISQEDIDGFLSEDEEDLQTQSDGDDAGDGDDPRNIISQDDIDALLAGTDEEDEDLLADMEQDEDLDLSSAFGEDIDLDHEETDDGSQAVVLESPEKDDNVDSGASPSSKGEIEALASEEGDLSTKKRSLLKMILIILMVLIVIGGAVAAAYFFYFKKMLTPAPLPEDLPLPQMETIVETSPDPMDMAVEKGPVFNPGTIYLEEFMVIMPDETNDITYIYGDIAVDYSYTNVLDEISAKKPYYRDVIYKALQEGLKQNSLNRLTEDDLLDIVKDALNQALPAMQVDKVMFTEFQTG